MAGHRAGMTYADGCYPDGMANHAVDEPEEMMAIREWSQWGAIGVLALGCTMAVAATDTDTDKARVQQSEQERAEDAVDELTEKEENTEMPLPGQGYDDSNLLLDKAKDKRETGEVLERLQDEGKIVNKPDPKSMDRQ